jgi:hypothetical protein
MLGINGQFRHGRITALGDGRGMRQLLGLAAVRFAVNLRDS